MLINCTADDVENSRGLKWSIRLPDRQIFDDFSELQKDILNLRGFYQLAPIDIPVKKIRLIVNNTDDVNGTVLRCANVRSGQILRETTLLVYG